MTLCRLWLNFIERINFGLCLPEQRTSRTEVFVVNKICRAVTRGNRARGYEVEEKTRPNEHSSVRATDSRCLPSRRFARPIIFKRTISIPRRVYPLETSSPSESSRLVNYSQSSENLGVFPLTKNSASEMRKENRAFSPRIAACDGRRKAAYLRFVGWAKDARLTRKTDSLMELEAPSQVADGGDLTRESSNGR